MKVWPAPRSEEKRFDDSNFYNKPHRCPVCWTCDNAMLYVGVGNSKTVCIGSCPHPCCGAKWFGVRLNIPWSIEKHLYDKRLGPLKAESVFNGLRYNRVRVVTNEYPWNPCGTCLVCIRRQGLPTEDQALAIRS